MKKISITAVMCCALLMVSCNTPPKGDGTLTFVGTDGDLLTVCHFNRVTDTVEMNLSDLVEDFRIVRFENTDSAFFKCAMMPIVTDNYIGVRQTSGLPFLLFDKDGRLRCKVGSIGNGPGEYSQSIYDEAINEETGEIYLSFFAFFPKIMVYNTDGQFVREIVTKENLSKPKIEVDNDGDITIVHMPFENNKEKFLSIVYDKDGMFKQELKPALSFLQKDFNQDIFAYHNVPEFSFWLTSCDTLFHYNKKMNKVYPKFKMDFGNTSEAPLHIYNELSGYYLTEMLWNKGTVFVDKRARTSHYVKLVNDFFGHMQAAAFSFNKGWYCQMFEPGQLMSRIEYRLAKSDCSVEDRKQLETMLNSIGEDDNNILFLGKLKKIQ